MTLMLRPFALRRYVFWVLLIQLWVQFWIQSRENTFYFNWKYTYIFLIFFRDSLRFGNKYFSHKKKNYTNKLISIICRIWWEKVIFNFSTLEISTSISILICLSIWSILNCCHLVININLKAQFHIFSQINFILNKVKLNLSGL